MRALPRGGDLIANRYRVDKLLGRGGMGAAFSATNLVTGKQVALKWLLHDQSASRLNRVLREARAAGRVRHTNIVDVYDVGEHAGSLFLVMELLTGESLQAVIDARAPLQPRELLQWLLPALRGVAAAHRQGVIHRDLKPANIFLDRSDEAGTITAKVLDFGVSKIVAAPFGDDEPASSGGAAPQDVPDDASLTDSRALLGTPSYMAPEQLKEARSVDARSDVYACGVILYHALSGRRPFVAPDYTRLAALVANTDPLPLVQLRPELPGGLCSVVHRAMEREPECRFNDMPSLIDALEPFGRADSELAGGRERRLGRYVRAAAALAVGAGLALAGAAASEPTPVASDRSIGESRPEQALGAVSVPPAGPPPVESAVLAPAPAPVLEPDTRPPAVSDAAPARSPAGKKAKSGGRSRSRAAHPADAPPPVQPPPQVSEAIVSEAIIDVAVEEF